MRISDWSSDVCSSDLTHGVSAETLVADLEDASDLAALAARLETDPVAVLINNAGAGALGPTAIKGADAQESLIRLNIVALTPLSLAALAGLLKTGTGAVVNNSEERRLWTECGSTVK